MIDSTAKLERTRRKMEREMTQHKETAAQQVKTAKQQARMLGYYKGSAAVLRDENKTLQGEVSHAQKQGE